MAIASDYSELAAFSVTIDGVDVSKLALSASIGASMFDTAVPGVFGQLTIRDSTGMASAVKDALYNAGVPITIRYSDAAGTATHVAEMVSAGLIDGSKGRNNRFMTHKIMLSLESFLTAGQNTSLASMAEPADAVIQKLFQTFDGKHPLEIVAGKVLAEKEHFLINSKPVLEAIRMTMNRFLTADAHNSNSLLFYGSYGKGIKYVLDSIPGILEKGTKGSPTIWIGGQGRVNPLFDPRTPFTAPPGSYHIEVNTPNYRSASMQYGGGSATDAVFSIANSAYTPGQAASYNPVTAFGSKLTSLFSAPTKQHRINLSVFDPRLSAENFAESRSAQANVDELAFAGSPHHTLNIPSITDKFYVGGSVVINDAQATMTTAPPGPAATAGHCVITELTHYITPIKRAGPKAITAIGCVQTGNQGIM